MITCHNETPILLVAYGHPETALRVYSVLQQVKPQRLYLFYDKPFNEAERLNMDQIRVIFKETEWECKIKTCNNKTHTGYNASMLKAIRWFFSHEAEGIVLDCHSVPPPAFFAFCSCLLEKYRYDERIGHISGSSFRKPERKLKSDDSYFFSKLVHVHRGWASWRRVWQDMAVALKTFPAFQKLKLIDELPAHRPVQFHWYHLFQQEERWDIRYEYVNLINNRLSVVPDMRNLSFDEDELPELKHPAFMISSVTEELKQQELKHRMPTVTLNKPEGIPYLQDKLALFGVEAARRMKIPRIIHQIYEDPAGPTDDLLRISESWKKKMPGWEYRFWDKKAMSDFMESSCPDFCDYYDRYPFDVQRWDAIRYLILYHIGGLYVDMDYECIRPLDVILCDATCCMGMEPAINGTLFGKPALIGNALMAAKPKHPFMAAIIDDMKANSSVEYKQGYNAQILESTGPYMVLRVYERFKQKKTVTLLPADLVTPLTHREVLMLRTGREHPDLIKKLKNAYSCHYFFYSWADQTH